MTRTDEKPRFQYVRNGKTLNIHIENFTQAEMIDLICGLFLALVWADAKDLLPILHRLLLYPNEASEVSLALRDGLKQRGKGN